MLMARKKILLVDDSRTVLLAEQRILGSTRYEFVTAEDGVEALERAAEERPDLVLLDIEMPRLDGLETLRRLRAHPELDGVPVVMVTARREEEVTESSYTSGCSDYVAKPLHEDELRAKVLSLLGE